MSKTIKAEITCPKCKITQVCNIYASMNVSIDPELKKEFIFFEIGKNFDDIVLRSKLSKEELSEVFSFIKERVDTIPFENFNTYVLEAKTLAPHSKDIQYFALSLAFNKCPIWSDEKAFSKQNKINIFSTDKMLEKLYREQDERDTEQGSTKKE